MAMWLSAFGRLAFTISGSHLPQGARVHDILTSVVGNGPWVDTIASCGLFVGLMSIVMSCSSFPANLQLTLTELGLGSQRYVSLRPADS
ncbi:hypothetical protein BDV26DRAFT_256461 [Aspergillus bertholletiae]|uniref:Uncharacterized protein n=1 Tax=Aspergillus bertholletiae TaxID=1226010 RepID=A0A5N7BGK0_9EURO|nr:hypothetical protein BDV26DRAFT_256461 [Aspergillus bertholletiae]